ncbi:MAG: ribosome maturation factor RimM [Heliobacteriaceae bacterium]|nr:ribosome maturation factor RimM [Heliobacteriaceae bacterium]MDD4587027.1 ribosome maturation factor RimM [Heliobacteriaceae bacterium]
MERLVRVGQIVGSQGLKGQVRVWPLTDNSKRFFELTRVFLEAKPPDALRELNITGAYIHRRLVVVTFKEISDITAAAKLKGRYLTIPVTEVSPLPAGSYYHFQLEGLQVFTTTGQKLGDLTRILETGSNDVYVVQSAGREILIPALKSVVLQVDVGKGTMVVSLPAGLD